MFLIFDQHINLHWFLGKQMLRLKFQILCLLSQFNLQRRIKCRMPLDFVITCVQSFSPFIIIKILVLFNVKLNLLIMNFVFYTKSCQKILLIKMESHADMAVIIEILFRPLYNEIFRIMNFKNLYIRNFDVF